MNETNHVFKRRGEMDLPRVDLWKVAVNGSELLDGLSELLMKYVVLPRWGAEALALWVVHTYAWQLRDVTTYIGVVSPEKRCGKTMLLTLLSVLSYRAVMAASITPAAMFRAIEELEPALLIDEGDTFLHGKEELRGILNAGYSRASAYVVRMDPTKGNGLRKFSCWCPKVIAAIGELPETLADRCIMLRMQRKRTGEVCERVRKLDPNPWREKCMRFVLDHEKVIRDSETVLLEGLNDRAANIWEPLLAIADAAGGRWPELAREAALGLSGGKEDMSEWGMFMQHIQMTFEVNKAEKLFSRTLVDALRRIQNPDWARLRKGRPLTEIWLAQQLRKLGVAPRTVWIAGKTGKGYHLEDFVEAFGRYGGVESSKSRVEL